MILFDFTVNKASQQEIEKHLLKCADQFRIPLDKTLNIQAYSGKMRNYADTIEARCDGDLVGLAACYLNDYHSKIAFLTMLSVYKNYIGKGLGEMLLRKIIQMAFDKGFLCIKLEVDKENTIALNLYKKIGFTIVDFVNDKICMNYILK